MVDFFMVNPLSPRPHGMIGSPVRPHKVRQGNYYIRVVGVSVDSKSVCINTLYTSQADISIIFDGFVHYDSQTGTIHLNNGRAVFS